MTWPLSKTGGPSCKVGGWDNHSNIFTALHNGRNMNQGGLVDRLDKGMSAMVKDLVDRGLWKNTVVVGGGAIKGGLAYGSTDKDGTCVKDNPRTVGDLFATLCAGLGMSPDTEVRDPLGPPRKITGEKGGTALSGLV